MKINYARLFTLIAITAWLIFCVAGIILTALDRVSWSLIALGMASGGLMWLAMQLDDVRRRG